MTRPLSVVIAAKDAQDTLADQLDALVSQPWPNGGEIIVADNGSSDATALEAARFATADISVMVVDASSIPGAGHARNCGVEASSHDYVAFCDADDVVHESWVTSVSAALDETPAIGGKLEFDKLNPDWVVGSRGQLHAVNNLPSFDGVFPVLSSCNLGIHRTVFEDVGGFDESYLRGQDAELSMRLHHAGIEMGFAHDAIVHYRMRSGLASIYRQALGWGEVQHRLRHALADATPNDRKRIFRSWAWLATHPHLLATRAGRARLAYVAGIRVGVARAQLLHWTQR